MEEVHGSGRRRGDGLTCLAVEGDLVLELLALLQRVVDAEDDGLAALRPVQELAGAALLHDFGAGEARELAEAIRAVDNGEALGHLRVGQDEVAVCLGGRRRGEGRRERHRWRSSKGHGCN